MCTNRISGIIIKIFQIRRKKNERRYLSLDVVVPLLSSPLVKSAIWWRVLEGTGFCKRLNYERMVRDGKHKRTVTKTQNFRDCFFIFCNPVQVCLPTNMSLLVKVNSNQNYEKRAQGQVSYALKFIFRRF